MLKAGKVEGEGRVEVENQGGVKGKQLKENR
jgi:hypothetical protein